MDLNLKTKRAIVAGGSAGIGLASAASLLQEEARVVVVGRNAERLRTAEARLREQMRSDQEGDLRTVVADVSQPAEVERLVAGVVADWGGVDLLVDAVGKGHRGRLADLTVREWEENWRTNVLSAALLAQACASEMARGGGGSMVFLGAASGKQPTEGQLVSNVHKAGLMAFVSTLAGELAPDGIRVNLVCPGRSKGERRLEKARQVAAEHGTTIERYFAELSESIPLKRLADPAEVADLIVFLCSERSSYTTGQSISVDGGLVRSIL